MAREHPGRRGAGVASILDYGADAGDVAAGMSAAGVSPGVTGGGAGGARRGLACAFPMSACPSSTMKLRVDRSTPSTPTTMHTARPMTYGIREDFFFGARRRSASRNAGETWIIDVGIASYDGIFARMMVGAGTVSSDFAFAGAAFAGAGLAARSTTGVAARSGVAAIGAGAAAAATGAGIAAATGAGVATGAGIAAAATGAGVAIGAGIAAIGAVVVPTSADARSRAPDAGSACPLGIESGSDAGRDAGSSFAAAFFAIAWVASASICARDGGGSRVRLILAPRIVGGMSAGVAKICQIASVPSK
jgi:hypothetical protein